MRYLQCHKVTHASDLMEFVQTSRCLEVEYRGDKIRIQFWMFSDVGILERCLASVVCRLHREMSHFGCQFNGLCDLTTFSPPCSSAVEVVVRCS